MDPALAVLFGRTFLIGLAVAMPVGAMAVLCMERTLERGWGSGAATGLGIATADGVYAGLAAFGITALTSALTAWQAPLRAVGGVALVYLALRSLARSTPASSADGTGEEQTPSPGGVLRSYTSAVALTLTNPMTIIAFAAVFMSAGLADLGGPRSSLVATLGIFTGSLSWWLVLCSLVALARHRIAEGTARRLTRASAVALGIFGLLAIGSLFV